MALVAGRPLPMLALPVLLAAAGCAVPGPSTSLACGPGETEARELTAWFGLHSAARGRELSEVEWQEFRDRALTPRFPQGFTVVVGR
ncbi:DUF3574 domain-containing protein, partial [Acinetobacter baumannii]